MMIVLEKRPVHLPLVRASHELRKVAPYILRVLKMHSTTSLVETMNHLCNQLHAAVQVLVVVRFAANPTNAAAKPRRIQDNTPGRDTM